MDDRICENIGWGCNKVFSGKEMVIDGRLTGKGERIAVIESSGLNLVCDYNTVTKNEKAQAINAFMQGNSTVSFASGSVERFRENRMQMFLELIDKAATKTGTIVSVTDVQITFLKSV